MNSRRKRVCHVTCVHGTYDSRIFSKECVSLSAEYEVYLVGPGESRVDSNVNVIGCGKRPKNRIKRFFSYRKKVFNVAISLNCDMYHFHDPELLPFALKAKRQGKHVIFDSHEDVPRQIMNKYWIPKCMRKMVAGVYEKYEKAAASKIDYVVTATHKISNCFLPYNTCVETIFNYPIPEEFKQTAGIEKERAICFAGGLCETNGIKELIDIVDEIGEKLYLAGRFEEEIKKYLEIKERENIIYLGVISRQEVYDLYAKCELGIVVDLPTGNNIEGLPIKMFEYMICGLPFITSDFPIRREILEEYPCGILVDPCNREIFKESVITLLDNATLRESYSENGKKAVAEKYNWNYEREKLLKIYKEII